MAQIYKPKPRQAKAGKLLNQTVIGLDHQGRGIIRTQQGTRFAADVLPQEIVDIEPVGKYNATVLRIVEASPHRIKPACQYYQHCGGCDLQHLEHANQIQHKQQTVQDMLRKFGSIEAEQWLPPLVADAWNYRRRARLAVHYDRKRQHLKLGFRAPQSKQITTIDQCLTLAESLNSLLMPLRSMLEQTQLVRELGHVELIEFVAQPAVLLRLSSALSPHDRALLESFASQHDVAIWLQTDTGLHGLFPEQALPRYETANATLTCQPADFIQSHRQLSQAMVEQALAWLAIDDGDTIIELFAGSGNFTIPMAKTGAKVTAIEGVQSMVQQLQQNAAEQQLSIAAHCANLEQPWPQQSWGRLTYNKALLDPARAGAAQAVQDIAQRHIPRVVYVSCAPDTLARDAAVLKAQGYTLKQAQMIDMFPQTHHIEVITLFTRE